MKPIGDKKLIRALNAWGRPEQHYEQAFVIEQSDVGVNKPHYLGHNNCAFQIKAENVGQVINVYTDGTDWTCWHWKRR